MPNLADALKSEIARLARKEIRSEIESLRKAGSSQRTQLAALRVQVKNLERAFRRYSKGAQSNAPEMPGNDGDESSLRFRASGLAAHRKRLGLSAADFGQLLGVSGQSVYKWESGEVRPRRSQLEAIAVVRKLGKREALARLQG